MDIIKGANWGKIGERFAASGAAKYYYLRQELDKHKGINPFMGLSGSQIERDFIYYSGRLERALSLWGMSLIDSETVRTYLITLLKLYEVGTASGSILPNFQTDVIPDSLKLWAVNHSPVAVRPVAGRIFLMVPDIDGSGTGAEIQRYMMTRPDGATKEDIHQYLSGGGFITGGLKDFKLHKYLDSDRYRCNGRKYYLR
jgi:hypothetical protein